jgi:DNA polymerase-3 subunit epsilon
LNFTAALKFYTGKDMEGAHDARFDVEATIDVFYGQMKHYGFGPERIAEISAEQMKGRLDVTNKFCYDDNKEICFNFGKNKGMPARKDPGYLKWMLAGEFHYSAKTICENILRELEK